MHASAAGRWSTQFAQAAFPLPMNRPMVVLKHIAQILHLYIHIHSHFGAMANVTFDLLWRESMRELLDLLELEQPPDDFGSWKEEQVISHFSYLYIRYVLLYTSLEDCMDQHVHAQKRKDIQAAVESVMVSQHPYFLK
jgi:hypothetical protein